MDIKTYKLEKWTLREWRAEKRARDLRKRPRSWKFWDISIDEYEGGSPQSSASENNNGHVHKKGIFGGIFGDSESECS